MDRRRWCIAIVLVPLMIPSSGQASFASVDLRIRGVGAPFDDTTGAYGQYYWSGAYAEAEDDWFYLYDDQYDPLGYPLPGVASLTAATSVGGALVSAETAPGTVRIQPTATLLPGESWAHGYADATHWVEFEVTNSPVEVGVAYEVDYALAAGTPQGEAFVYAEGWAGLFVWIDDDLEGDRDFDEWYGLDSTGYSDGWSTDSPNFLSWSDGGEYWFDELVDPGVYSLCLGGRGEVGTAVAIPAPSALLLGGLGLAAVRGLRRRGVL